MRHVVGTNVAVIVGVGGMPTWPELLMSIVQCLESNDPNALEGALDALYKVLHNTFIAKLSCTDMFPSDAYFLAQGRCL